MPLAAQAGRKPLKIPTLDAPGPSEPSDLFPQTPDLVLIHDITGSIIILSPKEDQARSRKGDEPLGSLPGAMFF